MGREGRGEEGEAEERGEEEEENGEGEKKGEEGRRGKEGEGKGGSCPGPLLGPALTTDGVISLAFEQRRLERLFTAEADAQVVDDGGRQ